MIHQTIKLEEIQPMSSQQPMSAEDLNNYLTYAITHEIKDEKHQQQLSKLSKRLTTMSDVFAICKALEQPQEHVIGQLMDAIQIQDRVLRNLGATPDMFIKAQEEHNGELKKMEATIRKNMEVENTNAEVSEEASND